MCSTVAMALGRRVTSVQPHSQPGSPPRPLNFSFRKWGKEAGVDDLDDHWNNFLCAQNDILSVLSVFNLENIWLNRNVWSVHKHLNPVIPMSRDFHWIFAGTETKLIQFISFPGVRLKMSIFFHILILLNHFSINSFPYLHFIMTLFINQGFCPDQILLIRTFCNCGFSFYAHCQIQFSI